MSRAGFGYLKSVETENARSICRSRLLFLAAAGLYLLSVGHTWAEEAPVAAETPAPAPAIGQSESRTSVEELAAKDWGEDFQVRVTGSQPLTRVMFSSNINDFRDDFRWLLFVLNIDSPGDRSVWSVPIQVELFGDFVDVHKGDYLRTKVQIRPDNRFIIKLEVKLHDGFQESEFRLAFLRALLMEQIIAPFAAAPDTFTLSEVKVPDWLAHGFDQLILHRRGGSPSAFYKGFLASGQMLKPGEIFAMKGADKLDPVNYAIFRASAAAMVEALLDQPDGDAGLRSLLGDLGRSNPVSFDVLLREHFPAFREMDQGLDKWWALEVASLGQQQGFEFLNREETERFLTDALTVSFGAGPVVESPKRGLFDFKKSKNETLPSSTEAFTGTIAQYADYLGRAGVKEQFAASFDRLQRLKRIGFPLYRPVFTAYESVIVKLAKGETREIDAELKSIEEMRTKIRETLIRTEDYLNYFEATRAPQRSEAFDDYMEMRKSLEEKDPPKRNDHITRYLDALEIEFR